MKPLVAIHPHPIVLRGQRMAAPAVPSRTQQLCTHLQQRGPSTAKQLEQATGIHAIRVGALLKDNIARGRVRATKLHGGVNQYHWQGPA